MLTLTADGWCQSVGRFLGSRWAALGWRLCVNIDSRWAASVSRCMSG